MSALIVIDVQEGFDDEAFWGPTANPAAEANVVRLLDVWQREARGPVVIVRHDSVNPDSPLAVGGPGNALKPPIAAVAPDLLVTKQVNSAFYGEPDLHAWLQRRGEREIVVCGIQTNMCVETTARMAGNLGYAVTVPLDATRTFDLATGDGDQRVSMPAADLMRATALNLAAGGFARVTNTDQVVRG